MRAQSARLWVRALPAMAALLTSVLTSVPRLRAQGPAEVAAASHGFVIGVVTKDGKAEAATFASGFFIGDRHIVTQLAKCCSPPEGVQLKGYVVSAHGQNSAAQPIWTSKEKIAAVFELEKPVGGASATLVPVKMVQQNQPVFAFGLKEGKPVPIEGTVAGVVSMKDSNAKLIQVKIAGEIHQGSALFDGCGNVAGLVLGTGAGGDLLVLAVDELADGIAAAKANPPAAAAACGSVGGAGGQKESSKPGPGADPGQKARQPNKPPLPSSDALKYTLIVVAVLLAVAFASKKGRAEVARVMTSRRQPALDGVQQPMIQPPGQYPGQFQGPLGPGQMQYASAQAYYPGTRARLRGVSGYYAGSAVDLESSPWVLGRDPRVANIVFPAATETVSKKHCTISFDPSRSVFVLEDNGSTNGTWLPNGESLPAGRPRDLQAGERFCVGDMNNIFEVVLE